MKHQNDFSDCIKECSELNVFLDEATLKLSRILILIRTIGTIPTIQKVFIQGSEMNKYLRKIQLMTYLYIADNIKNFAETEIFTQNGDGKTLYLACR